MEDVGQARRVHMQVLDSVYARVLVDTRRLLTMERGASLSTTASQTTEDALLTPRVLTLALESIVVNVLLDSIMQIMHAQPSITA